MDETATVKSFRREKKVDPHKLGTEYRTLYPKGRLSYSQKSEDYYSYIRSWETAQTACYQLPNEKERLKGTTRFIFLHGSERSRIEVEQQYILYTILIDPQLE